MGIAYSATTVARTGAERATLVRRTYALVFASVLVTMGGAAFGLSQPALMQAVARHPFLTLLCVLAPLFLAMRARNSVPQSLGFVALFTFVEGVWISPLLFVYGQTQPGIISQAALLTVGTFGVLTAYAFVSRRDFSAWGSFFVVGLWVLIGTSLLNMFFRNETASLWIAATGLIVMSGLLVYDTWRLRNEYGPDDYVPAAVNIYLDLLNMFLFILRLLGGRRD
jgi:FtsH-binding integral membrane protein